MAVSLQNNEVHIIVDQSIQKNSMKSEYWLNYNFFIIVPNYWPIVLQLYAQSMQRTVSIRMIYNIHVQILKHK